MVHRAVLKPALAEEIHTTVQRGLANAARTPIPDQRPSHDASDDRPLTQQEKKRRGILKLDTAPESFDDAPPTELPPGVADGVELTYGWEYFSPRRCHETILRHGGRNRWVIPRNYERLLADMTGNNWRANGSTIVFSRDGYLDDGQHRLLAARDAGRGIWMFVVRGVPSDAFGTMDTGISRRPWDVVASKGIRLPTIVASTAPWVAHWIEHNSFDTIPASMPNDGAIKFAEEYPELHASVDWASRNVKQARGVLTVTQLAIVHFVLNLVDADAAKSFLDQLIQGYGDPNDVIWKGRKRLLDGVGFSEQAKGTRDLRPRIAIAFKIWNFWRTGENRDRFIYRPSNGEPFPVPK